MKSSIPRLQSRLTGLGTGFGGHGKIVYTVRCFKAMFLYFFFYLIHTLLENSIFIHSQMNKESGKTINGNACLILRLFSHGNDEFVWH